MFQSADGPLRVRPFVRVWLQLAPSLCGAKTVEVLFLDGISGHVGRHRVLSGLVSHPRRIIRLLQQHFFFCLCSFFVTQKQGPAENGCAGSTMLRRFLHALNFTRHLSPVCIFL
jgi:hypothetical protein